MKRTTIPRLRTIRNATIALFLTPVTLVFANAVGCNRSDTGKSLYEVASLGSQPQFDVLEVAINLDDVETNVVFRNLITLAASPIENAEDAQAYASAQDALFSLDQSAFISQVATQFDVEPVGSPHRYTLAFAASLRPSNAMCAWASDYILSVAP